MGGKEDGKGNSEGRERGGKKLNREGREGK